MLSKDLNTTVLNPSNAGTKIHRSVTEILSSYSELPKDTSADIATHEPKNQHRLHRDTVDVFEYSIEMCADTILRISHNDSYHR